MIRLVGVLVGAVVGLGIGAGVYLLVNPALESADGWPREMQGFAWNLVPVLTVLGGVVGYVVIDRRSRH